MVTPSVGLISDFVPFFGEPRECRGNVAFPPSFAPQPSGAIEGSGTNFESTLCCVAPRLGVRDSQSMAEVSVLCCQRRSTVAVCDECKEHCCNECIDTHTCWTNVVS